METQLLDVRGLSKRLRLPATWLAQEAEAGRIPSLKIGRKFRFNASAVEAALAERAAALPEGTVPDAR